MCQVADRRWPVTDHRRCSPTMESDYRGRPLVDRDGGNIFSFALWENEEAMRASEEAGNRLRPSGLRPGFPHARVERYELGVLEID
jgi:hypothetical protein